MSAQPELVYSEAGEALLAAVRDLLTDRCDAARGIARTARTPCTTSHCARRSPAAWAVAGPPVPEGRGGQGATHREAAVVLEELGRASPRCPI
ncbi:acyl-CoA dehydrogenase family protein [Streptomyces hirsutus]